MEDEVARSCERFGIVVEQEVVAAVEPLQLGVRAFGAELIIEGPSCYRQPEKVYGYEAAAPKWNTLQHPVVAV